MDEIEAFYDRNAQNEWDRLDRHRTEFAITLRAFEEYLPRPPLDVLDIGGGPGRYSIALAKRGYKVILMDLSKRCLEFAKGKATESGVELTDFAHGTALDLSGFLNDSFGVVLLMGPLYHASFITRYAPFRWAAKNEPEWLEQGRRLLETGVWRPSLDGTPSRTRVGFTDSYFATPVEIKQLMESEKFEALDLVACEGIVSMIEEKVNELEGQAFDAWVELNYRLSKDPGIHGSAEHLLYVGRKKS